MKVPIRMSTSDCACVLECWCVGVLVYRRGEVESSGVAHGARLGCWIAYQNALPCTLRLFVVVVCCALCMHQRVAHLWGPRLGARRCPCPSAWRRGGVRGLVRVCACVRVCICIYIDVHIRINIFTHSLSRSAPCPARRWSAYVDIAICAY